MANATHGETHTVSDPIELPALQQALALRERVVAALAVAAESFTGRRRWQWKRLSDQVAYTKTVEELIHQPHPLALFLEVSKQCGPDASQSDVDAVVGSTLSQLPPPPSNVLAQFLLRLLYPAIVLGIAMMVLVLLSVFLVPSFETMFNEFGLSLPAPTKAVIGMSHLLRSVSTYLFLGFVGLLAILLVVGPGEVFDLIQRSFGRGDRKVTSVSGATFANRQRTWADWAWHLSLLLRAGLSMPQSILIAGRSSGKSWLRSGSQLWSHQLSEGFNPFKDVTHFRGTPCRLLALALTQPEQQSELLRDIAELYWSRSRATQASWIWAVSPLASIAVGMVVGFIVIALFMPLLQLISGLS